MGRKNMLEEIVNLVPPVNLMKIGSHDPKIIRTVAEFKRLADIWRLDAEFRESYRLNPDKAIAQTGLHIEPEAFRLYTDPEEAEKRLQDIMDGKLGPDAFPESYLLYQSAAREMHQQYKKLGEKCFMPDEPNLRIWRQRQNRRCRLQFGAAAYNMMEAPLTYELSEGCSVGCSFCGAAAKGLRGVFRYTEENALLWRETLRRMHALMGDAAGYGTCYYATEGLDNPDYEKFLADYYREYGVIPPTTTAVSTRNLERTRALLHFHPADRFYFDRFSVLSPSMRDTLLNNFTPEELLKVILLPQFPEAPANNFVKAGRNRGSEDMGETIACTSGFIVNMQEKTVRLLTPCASDRHHPTGEWILEKCAFTSAEDLEIQIRWMISQYMREKLDLKKPCRSSCDFRLETKDGKIWAFARAKGILVLQTSMRQTELSTLIAALKKGTYTCSDILDLLSKDTDVMSGFLLLNMLWYHGLIDQSCCLFTSSENIPPCSMSSS